MNGGVDAEIAKSKKRMAMKHGKRYGID